MTNPTYSQDQEITICTSTSYRSYNSIIAEELEKLFVGLNSYNSSLLLKKNASESSIEEYKGYISKLNQLIEEHGKQTIIDTVRGRLFLTLVDYVNKFHHLSMVVVDKDSSNDFKKAINENIKQGKSDEYSKSKIIIEDEKTPEGQQRGSIAGSRIQAVRTAKEKIDPDIYLLFEAEKASMLQTTLTTIDREGGDYEMGVIGRSESVNANTYPQFQRISEGVLNDFINNAIREYLGENKPDWLSGTRFIRKSAIDFFLENAERYWRIDRGTSINYDYFRFIFAPFFQWLKEGKKVAFLTVQGEYPHVQRGMEDYLSGIFSRKRMRQAAVIIEDMCHWMGEKDLQVVEAVKSGLGKIREGVRSLMSNEVGPSPSHKER